MKKANKDKLNEQANAPSKTHFHEFLLAMEESERWNRVVVPHVFLVVSARVSLRDVCSLSSVNNPTRRILFSYAPLWKVLDLHGANRAGERLAAALAQPRFEEAKEINLEFAQGLEDGHLKYLEGKEIQTLNLNACQTITDVGVQIVAKNCPKLRSFSIYWNLRVTDNGIKALLKNCTEITTLNLSGCKGMTNKILETICTFCVGIKILNLTRCLKLTDEGLAQLLENCPNIEVLYLYAISSFTDKSYTKLSNLRDLKVLDLCGAQNLTDNGVSQGFANCKALESLNLTWCVNVTDIGIESIANNCHKLHLLSLHGLLGVTDKGLESVSRTCAAVLTTIDVNGCVNIKKRSKTDLLKLFPHVQVFNVHS